MDTRHFRNSFLIKLPISESVQNASRIALAELDISPYGASCGSAIKHEVSEYIILRYMQPFGIFNYLMYKYGKKAKEIREDE